MKSTISRKKINAKNPTFAFISFNTVKDSKSVKSNTSIKASDELTKCWPMDVFLPPISYIRTFSCAFLSAVIERVYVSSYVGN